MKNLLLYSIIAASCFVSCKKESEKSYNDLKVDSNVIELVSFGSATIPSPRNKGFGLAYYIHLNLENDSVYFQSRIDPIDDPKLVSLAGVIRGLAENDTIVKFIEASKQINNGNVTTTTIPVGMLYCGRNFYSRHSLGKMKRFHYYTLYNLDERFKQATEYFLALQANKQLKQVNRAINEDSIVAPLVTKEGFRFLPPPIIRKSTINFPKPLK